MPALVVPAWSYRSRLRKGYPEVVRFARSQPRELRIDHAGNGERGAVEPHGSTNNVCRSAKGALPITVAQHDYGWSIGSVIRGLDRAAKGRGNTQGLKVIAGDEFATNHAGRAVATQIQLVGTGHRQHAGEGVSVGEDRPVYRIGKGTALDGRRHPQAVAVAARAQILRPTMS